MRRKAVQLMLGISMCLAAAPATCAFAEEEAVAVETEAATEAATEETETEAATEAETETETETETSDFIEGSALLSDYDYKEGELSENGWKSDFLMMEYVPGDGVTMAVDENDKLDEYYKRNGEDKMVANSEMVAKDADGGYVQMTVEVNPNNESEEDILDAFKEIEELDLAGKDKEMEIGGKTFLTSTGVIDKERYLLGVSTDQDDIVIAIKVKYEDTEARKALTDGFEELEAEDEEAEEEEAAEADEDAEEADDATEAEEDEEETEAAEEDAETEEASEEE